MPGFWRAQPTFPGGGRAPKITTPPQNAVSNFPDHPKFALSPFWFIPHLPFPCKFIPERSSIPEIPEEPRAGTGPGDAGEGEGGSGRGKLTWAGQVRHKGGSTVPGTPGTASPWIPARSHCEGQPEWNAPIVAGILREFFPLPPLCQLGWRPAWKLPDGPNQSSPGPRNTSEVSSPPSEPLGASKLSALGVF